MGNPRGDLVVDLPLLEQTAGSLSMLIEEFNNAGKIVSSYHASVGDPTLTGALDDFANDWSVHRKDLVSSMQSVYQMATKSHKAYIDTDDNLAKELRKDGAQ
jgi:hypothetical protein